MAKEVGPCTEKECESGGEGPSVTGASRGHCVRMTAFWLFAVCRSCEPPGTAQGSSGTRSVVKSLLGKSGRRNRQTVTPSCPLAPRALRSFSLCPGAPGRLDRTADTTDEAAHHSNVSTVQQIQQMRRHTTLNLILGNT